MHDRSVVHGVLEMGLNGLEILLVQAGLTGMKEVIVLLVPPCWWAGRVSKDLYACFHPKLSLHSGTCGTGFDLRVQSVGPGSLSSPSAPLFHVLKARKLTIYAWYGYTLLDACQIYCYPSLLEH